MTLENLLAIHRLVRHEADPASLSRLLAAAARNLSDYEGVPIGEAVVETCITEAGRLLELASRRIGEGRA